MALQTGSDMWQKGFFSECPSCHKKGFYQPRAMITKKKIYYYNKGCKYCGYVENDKIIKKEEYI